MYCEKCGQQISENAQFCSHCGNCKNTGNTANAANVTSSSYTHTINQKLSSLQGEKTHTFS